MLVPSWLKAAFITAVQAVAAALVATFGFAAVDVVQGDDVDWVATLGDFRTAVAAALLPLVVALHRAFRPPEQTYNDPQPPAPPPPPA
jgi:hypothetical protein